MMNQTDPDTKTDPTPAPAPDATSATPPTESAKPEPAQPEKPRRRVFCSLDLETGGFKFLKSAVTSYGAVFFEWKPGRRDPIIICRIGANIRPAKGLKVSRAALGVQGKKRKQVYSKKHATEAEAFSGFWKIYKNYEMPPIVGHNVSFDFGFLKAWGTRVGCDEFLSVADELRRATICTQRGTAERRATGILPPGRNSLDDALATLGIASRTSAGHSANEDAELTAQLFTALQYADREFHGKLLKASAGPLPMRQSDPEILKRGTVVPAGTIVHGVGGVPVGILAHSVTIGGTDTDRLRNNTTSRVKVAAGSVAYGHIRLEDGSEFGPVRGYWNKETRYDKGDIVAVGRLVYGYLGRGSNASEREQDWHPNNCLDWRLLGPVAQFPGFGALLATGKPPVETASVGMNPPAPAEVTYTTRNFGGHITMSDGRQYGPIRGYFDETATYEKGDVVVEIEPTATAQKIIYGYDGKGSHATPPAQDRSPYWNLDWQRLGLTSVFPGLDAVLEATPRPDGSPSLEAPRYRHTFRDGVVTTEQVTAEVRGGATSVPNALTPAERLEAAEPAPLMPPTFCVEKNDIYGPFYGEWKNGGKYPIGAVVKFEGNLYRNAEAGAELSPLYFMSGWRRLGSTSEIRFIPAERFTQWGGVDRCGPFFGEYRAGVNYPKRAVVIDDQIAYILLSDNGTTRPAVENGWRVLAWVGDPIHDRRFANGRRFFVKRSFKTWTLHGGEHILNPGTVVTLSRREYHGQKGNTGTLYTGNNVCWLVCPQTWKGVHEKDLPLLPDAPKVPDELEPLEGAYISPYPGTERVQPEEGITYRVMRDIQTKPETPSGNFVHWNGGSLVRLYAEPGTPTRFVLLPSKIEKKGDDPEAYDPEKYKGPHFTFVHSDITGLPDYLLPVAPCHTPTPIPPVTSARMGYGSGARKMKETILRVLEELPDEYLQNDPENPKDIEAHKEARDALKELIKNLAIVQAPPHFTE